MDPRTLLRENLTYNYWARDRQLEACASLDPEMFLRPVGGSFSSLRDTLAHMCAVEWLWLERWRGRSVKALIPASEFPDVASLAERWREVEGEMFAWVEGIDEQALVSPLTCISTRGETWTFPLRKYTTHLLLHQSYHRGQVTTQLRLLGVQPPRVDFLLWPGL